MVQKTDVEDIESLDELPTDWGKFLIIFLPLIVYAGNFFERINWLGSNKYVHGLLGKGNRLTTFELIFVIAGFSVDDIGTAIGMQAEERPRKMVEGNPLMSGLMHFWINSGLAKTETAAHRLTYFMFLAWVLVIQYFGFYTSVSRLYIMATAVGKAYAGYQWWSAKPNDFTIGDFFSFKDGRPTAERMSIPLMDKFNKQAIVGFGESLKVRRRLVETTPMGWYEKYLPILFPAM